MQDAQTGRVLCHCHIHCMRDPNNHLLRVLREYQIRRVLQPAANEATAEEMILSDVCLPAIQLDVKSRSGWDPVPMQLLTRRIRASYKDRMSCHIIGRQYPISKFGAESLLRLNESSVSMTQFESKDDSHAYGKAWASVAPNPQT